MDGMEFLREIRQTLRLKTYVIFITGWADLETAV
jgi:DNA-binding response OmpR family regulator